MRYVIALLLVLVLPFNLVVSPAMAHDAIDYPQTLMGFGMAGFLSGLLILLSLGMIVFASSMKQFAKLRTVLWVTAWLSILFGLFHLSKLVGILLPLPEFATKPLAVSGQTRLFAGIQAATCIVSLLFSLILAALTFRRREPINSTRIA